VHNFEVWLVAEQMYAAIRELSSRKNKREGLLLEVDEKGTVFAYCRPTWKNCNVALKR
jgi:hypothetical protein